MLLLSGCLQAPETTLHKKKPKEPQRVQTLEPTAADIARDLNQLGGKLVRNETGSVRYVVLTGLPVGDKALESIDKLPDLEVLGLNGTRVTDEGMLQLSGLKRLAYLFLNDTEVTDKGLLSLSNNRSLRYISMNNTNLSPAAVSEFHRLSPGTLVEYSAHEKGLDDFYTSPNETAVAQARAAEAIIANGGEDLTRGRGGETGENTPTRSKQAGNVVLRYRREPPAESGE